MPDPRSQLFVTHSAEDLLRQQVFQILAGYPDGYDARQLRDDPLFKTIVGVDPREEERPLASGSTLNRFQHAYTRREAEKPRQGGPNVRYVVTNKPGHADDVYRDFYPQRGNVPERPIGELTGKAARNRATSGNRLRSRVEIINDCPPSPNSVYHYQNELR